MKESDIINLIIYPLLKDAGYNQNEIRVDYAITSYASKDSSGIRLRPDIVLLDKQNRAILVIEAKSPIRESSLEDAKKQALRYSDALNLPIYAATNGNSFQLVSKNKGQIYHTDSIVDSYNEIVEVLNKENLRKYSFDSREDDLDGVEIELEQKWISQINKEIFDENENEIKTLGARAIGWLGERVFEKYCNINGIPIVPAMLGYADFIARQEKITVKTIIEEEGKKQKRSVLQLSLNSLEGLILILVVVRVKKDEDEFLGYSFHKASIIGYIPMNKISPSCSLNNKYLLKRSELLPIDHWRSIKNGEVNL
jgi:hypothetical protein